MTAKISARFLLLQVLVGGLLFAICDAQRPPYAGQRPTGYKDRLSNSTATTSVVPLDNRFGGAGDDDRTPPRLPTAALGDSQLVNQLNQRPMEQRPFWLVNYEAIEAQKNGGRLPSGAAAPAVTNVLPELTNRFAGSDDSVPAGPGQLPGVATGRPEPGSVGDAGNYLVSRPEIVYPLPEAVAQSREPTVIMLNGQAFLLTPLGPAAGPRQPVQQQLFFD